MNNLCFLPGARTLYSLFWGWDVIIWEWSSLTIATASYHSLLIPAYAAYCEIFSYRGQLYYSVDLSNNERGQGALTCQSSISPTPPTMLNVPSLCWYTSGFAFCSICGILIPMIHRQPHRIPLSSEKDVATTPRSICVNKILFISDSGYPSFLKWLLNVRFETSMRLYIRNHILKKQR
jgi:hypothetical protein